MLWLLFSCAASAATLRPEGLEIPKMPEAPSPAATPALDAAKLDLPVETFQLPNGLTLVVQPDHSSPVAAVSITYRVGSLDERPGLSGFAHLFEHLMAQGTKSLRPREISQLVAANGGVRNASTSKSRTNYYSVVPRSALDLILWAEAERMHLLNVDARALAMEQNVVLEEMRLRYLNVPYARAQSAVLAETAFQRFENRHVPIGDVDDIRGAKLDDVRAFYQAHYAPNNAVIAISGDVTPQAALDLVTRRFGAIPPAPPRPTADFSEPPLAGERRAVYEDPLAKVPRLLMAWHSPERGSKDFWPLHVLREVMSGAEASPFYRELVKSSKVALDAGTGFPYFSDHSTMRGPDLFLALAIPRPGVAAQAVSAAVDAFLSRIGGEGPSNEDVARAKAQIRLDWLHGLESVEDRANLLSAYAAFVGDPKGLAGDLAALAAVTAEDVRAAAARWLAGRGRAVVEIVPGAPQPQAARQELPVPEASPRAPGDTPPAVAREGGVPVPAMTRFTLGNGLKVVVIPDRRLPLVEARLSIKPAGAASESASENGLSEAAADLLLKGTGRLDAAGVAGRFMRLGFDVRVGAGLERLLLRARGLSSNLEDFLTELSEILTDAQYPGDEVALWKEQEKEALKNRRVDPGFMTEERLKRELFPGHAYGRPAPDEAEIDALTPERLRRFRASHVAPDGATLVLTGDVDPVKIQEQLERGLGRWRGRSSPPAIPALPDAGAKRLAFIDRTGSQQVNLTITQTVALSPKDPDFLALSVANKILGGGDQGRLFLNLRVQHGYTYGSYSAFEPRKLTTLWDAAAQVRPEVAQAALDEMRREIARLRDEPIDESVLEQAKRYLAGIFLMQLSSQDRAADFVDALLDQERDPETALEGYLKRLNALTPADIQAAARRYLDPERMVTVAVGDGKTLPPLR